MELIMPNPTDHLPFEIRLATVDDLPFIKDSWLLAIKYIYPNQYELDFADNFQPHMQKIIQGSVIVVAHLAEEPNEILSYLIYTSFRHQQIIHYGYTKVDARRQGLLNHLICFTNPHKLPIVFTHPAKNQNVMAVFCRKYIYSPSAQELL